MSDRPHEVKFRFLANNTDPDDESGTATWVVPVWRRGGWDTETIAVAFKSFRDANRMNSVLNAVWKAGDYEAREECERRVLLAIGR